MENRRKAGRPFGSTSVTKKAKVCVTIDQDLLDSLNKLPNKSAVVNDALRIYISGLRK